MVTIKENFVFFVDVKLQLTKCRFAMGGIFSTNIDRSNEISVTTKLSAEHETPPIANVLLAVRAFFIRFKF